MTRVAEPGLLVRRRDGRDDLFRAQWGGSDAALAAAFAGPRALRAAADWQCVRRGVARSAWLARLDYLRTAAVYVRETETRVFLPLWAGLPTVGFVADPRAGVLAGVGSAADARRLRRRWRDLKGALADAVERDVLTVAGAVAVLCGAVADRETVPRHAGPSRGLL